MTAPLNIAVVGSGIAGLAATWLLGRCHHVTLFERHARPGMGAFNLACDTGAAPVRIDVPLRVFKSGYYDTLMALYRAAGVQMQPTDHAAAFTTAEGDAYFGYRNLLLGGRSIPLPTDWRGRARRITRELLRFLRHAPRDRASGRARGLTLGDYLQTHPYDAAFVDGMLLPSLAAICTCSYAAVRRYPAETLIDFFTSGSLTQGTWRARFGADDAIARLLQPCHELICEARVAAVETGPEQAVVTDVEGRQRRFDHVIVATQANQAGALVGGTDTEAATWLQQVPYEASEVVVHGDADLIPRSARHAPVHFRVDPAASGPMANIRLNHIVPELRQAATLYQTWNPLIEPAADQVLGRARFERPLVTLDSQSAMAALVARQTRQPSRLWFCGSYLMPGIPLLESAAQSAVHVAGRLGVPTPWATRTVPHSLTQGARP